jgi:hypothetical protein
MNVSISSGIGVDAQFVREAHGDAFVAAQCLSLATRCRERTDECGRHLFVQRLLLGQRPRRTSTARSA